MLQVSENTGIADMHLDPRDPDILYVVAYQMRRHVGVLVAGGPESGIWKSADGGVTWRDVSGGLPLPLLGPRRVLGPDDPHRMDRVYAADVRLHVTEDGGRTFEPVNMRFKHVDNHAVVFDPADPEYLLVGTDGNIYESFDRAKMWRYAANLPLTQFYRVGLDDAA